MSALATAKRRGNRCQSEGAAAAAAEHSSRALECQKLGRSTEAAHAAIRAISLDPGDATALKVLARIHLDAGQHEAAQQACLLVLKRDAQDAEARQMMEEALAQEAKLAENLYDRTALPPAALPRKAAAPTPDTRTESLEAALAEVENNWNEFGKRDPLWAILTDDAKRNGQWDPAEFFASGEREIGGVLKYARGFKPAFGRSKALDFGCGVGRLTQALCRHFEECHGVDIAESMVEQARHYNRHGARCHYHVNKKPDLALFGDDEFDFIYTNIVLQHNPPEAGRRFLQEFLRILKPGGQLVFQLPSEPLGQLGPPGAAMKNGAFQARLALDEPLPQLTAGTSHRLQVTVKNVSPETWPGPAVSGRHGVRLGNHWRDANHRLVMQDDARADLPHDLKPNQEITLPLTVTVPGAPGRFRLELDMVQEQVGWFAGKGSPTLLLDVGVAAPATPPSGPPGRQARAAKTNTLAPRMEMNGIPKAEVIEYLTKIGGKLLDVMEDGAAAGWVGYRYHVTKGQGSVRLATTSPPSHPPEARPSADLLAAPESPGPTTLPRVSGEGPLPSTAFRAHPVEWTDEKVRRFWDYMSSSVVGREEYFSRQVGQGVTNFLAAVCPQALGGAVLDFGCGPGYLLEPMGRVAGQIWGADSSTHSLKAAQERMGGNPGWKGTLQTNGGRIPLPDGGLDLITCVETIEHVVEEGLEPMLTELHRLLRRGSGLLLITTPFEERLERSEVFCPDCGCSFHRWQHVRRFGTGPLSSLIEPHGFATLLCVNLNFSDFQAAEFPVAGQPVNRSQILSRLGKGPHLIWLGKAI